MYFKLTHLVEDVFNLEIIDGSLSSSALLVEKEVNGLIEILAKRDRLNVHESTEEWYNI